MDQKIQKVVIDCDPGIDDSLALMLALSMEEIQVEAITIVCGNSPADMGFSNTKKILKHMGRLDIPIYVGAERPLKRDYVNALDTHGADGLGESFLPEVPGYENSMTAQELLKKRFVPGRRPLLRDRPGAHDQSGPSAFGLSGSNPFHGPDRVHGRQL